MASGAMVPGDRRPAGWLNVWSPDAAPGATVTDQAADANARAQQFAAFAVRGLPARLASLEPCDCVLGLHACAGVSWVLVPDSGVVVPQERMEEGLCRLAAAAITKRALDNVKKRCETGTEAGCARESSTENPAAQEEGGHAWRRHSQRWWVPAPCH